MKPQPQQLSEVPEILQAPPALQIRAPLSALGPPPRDLPRSSRRSALPVLASPWLEAPLALEPPESKPRAPVAQSSARLTLALPSPQGSTLAAAAHSSLPQPCLNSLCSARDRSPVPGPTDTAARGPSRSPSSPLRSAPDALCD